MTSSIPNERLPDVVLGRDRSFARDEAMAQLAASERPDREQLLAQVLENTYEPERYRAVAAIALGRIETPGAEHILLRVLTNTFDEVLPDVLRSLGRIGGRAALEAIEHLTLAPGHRASNVSAYAATLIAHRLGLPGHELPFPSEHDLLARPDKEIRYIDSGPADPETARRVLDDLKKHPYGIAFDGTTLTRIQCAGEVNVVCPNREFVGLAAEQLTKRKALLALVALQSAETGEYSVSHVVLSRPSGAGALAMVVHRASGKLALAGTARIAPRGLEFELRAVRRPGALAVALRGALHDGRLQLTEALTSTTREPCRVPARRVV